MRGKDERDSLVDSGREGLAGKMEKRGFNAGEFYNGTHEEKPHKVKVTEEKEERGNRRKGDGWGAEEMRG